MSFQNGQNALERLPSRPARSLASEMTWQGGYPQARSAMPGRSATVRLPTSPTMSR